MGTTTDSTCLVLVSGAEPTEGPEAARFFYSTGALQVPVTRGLVALQKYLSLQPVRSISSAAATVRLISSNGMCLLSGERGRI